MFNMKTIVGLLATTCALLVVSAPSLEAGHCHRNHCRRSNVNINVGPVVSAPAYVVRSPCYAPVYGYYPTPAPVVVYPTPVYQPVYVAPAPSFGFSFNWLFR